MTVRCSAKTSGITVERNPSQETLDKLGVTTWPTWGCGVSKFPWTYDNKETCYILKGDVTVTPDGGGDPVQVQAGDLATFPEGMSCTWDVKADILKHYDFS